MKVLSPISCLLYLAALSTAATVATPVFLGFSPDGEFAAMGQYLIQDGSGFPEASIVIVSTSDSGILRSFRTVMDYETWPEVENDESRGTIHNPAWHDVMEKAGRCLDSLHISGDLTGNHCICHPRTDTGSDPCMASFVPWVGAPGFTGPQYVVGLDCLPFQPENPPDWVSMFPEPVTMHLWITNREGDTLMSIRETSPPDDFRYVSSYGIRDVYVLGEDLVAVVLCTTVPGFEGSDGMFRLVTGKLATVETGY